MGGVEDAPTGSVASAIRECLEAIGVTVHELRVEGVDFADYVLVSADRLFIPEGTNIWRLKFKLRRLLPQSPESLTGLGGEIFVHVDSDAKTIVSVTYGE